MPVLNRDLYESLCDSNKKYLRDQDFILDDNNLSIDLGDSSNQIIDQLIENEKLNKQKENFKAKYVTQLMTIAFMLLAAGFTLASFFIATLIVLPILPILLIGFAILASIKFILSIKNNLMETHVTHLANTLDQLKEVDINVGREIVSAPFRETIQDVKDIKSQTEAVSKKIDKLEESHSSIAQLLVKQGAFSTATIPHSEPANELYDRESTSSPTHN